MSGQGKIVVVTTKDWSQDNFTFKSYLAQFLLQKVFIISP